MIRNKNRFIPACWSAAPLLLCLTALPAAASPSVAYSRTDTRTAQNATLSGELGPVAVQFLSSSGSPLSGWKKSGIKFLEYYERFPPILNIYNVVSVDAGCAELSAGRRDRTR